MAKAKLLEPQLPRRKGPADETTTELILPFILGGSLIRGKLWNGTECQRGISRKRTRSLTRPNVQFVRNSGSPTGRESYGDGDPVVVRGGESPSHGEGGQVLRGIHGKGRA